MDNQIRIGQGYDVHQLAVERKLVLGGVEIPNDRGLDGHSDADVLLHAIIDASLGAAALGDIGCMFPDNDPKYLDISSMKLLSKVFNLLSSNGYRIINIDSTIIAQSPKLQPYIMKMRENIAAACEISVEQVSVKATTEEHLGFTGRKEGISAQAIVLITKRQ